MSEAEHLSGYSRCSRVGPKNSCRRLLGFTHEPTLTLISKAANEGQLFVDWPSDPPKADVLIRSHVLAFHERR